MILICSLTVLYFSVFFFLEYDSDASCRYKEELSYENFITSGPDPHPPPIADDESDDDDDDDMPRVRYFENKNILGDDDCWCALIIGKLQS